jgi:6-phosphogluconolactonase
LQTTVIIPGIIRMNPDVRIFKDLELLSLTAVQFFFDRSVLAIQEHGRFLAVLNGGSTPQRFLQLLAADQRRKIEWEKTHIFWGDERCVPPDDAESSYGLARELLLHYVNIPESNVHRIRGELSPVEASKDYTLVLKQFSVQKLQWPRFDLVLLGMGEDGHTASLFPGSPVKTSEPVLAVTAYYQDRPAKRVTLTPPVFNSARLILFMVAGENKAITLSKVFSEPKQPELYPVQRIDPKDGESIWLVDEAAANKLPRRS